MIKKSIGLRILVLPLSLAVVVLIAVLYVQPAFSEIMKRKKSLDESRKQLVSIQAQTAKLAQLKASWDSMEEKKIVTVALPVSEATDDFLGELYQKVTSSGVLLDSFSTAKSESSEASYLCSAQSQTAQGAEGMPSSSSSAPSGAAGSPGVAISSSASSACVQNFSASIGAKGNWDQIISLLKYTSGMNRIVNLKKVSISKGGATGTENNPNPDMLSVMLDFELFYTPQKSTGTLAVNDLLVLGNGFDKSALSKIKEIVSSAYEQPVVIQSGERNMFK